MTESYFKSSIGRKQIVAITGLMLVLFLVGHLLGNLTMYWGPDAFNSYAGKLAKLRPALYCVEIALAGVFFIHIYNTFMLVSENVRARQRGYSDNHTKTRSISTRLMPFTGSLLFIFVGYHLWDFTFSPKEGLRSIIDGRDYYLYGVVYNSFSDPLHSIFYIVAMGCVGFHLSHGLHSMIQTLGFLPAGLQRIIEAFSFWFGWILAGLFASIPVAIMLRIIDV